MCRITNRRKVLTPYDLCFHNDIAVGASVEVVVLGKVEEVIDAIRRCR